MYINVDKIMLLVIILLVIGLSGDLHARNVPNTLPLSTSPEEELVFGLSALVTGTTIVGEKTLEWAGIKNILYRDMTIIDRKSIARVAAMFAWTRLVDKENNTGWGVFLWQAEKAFIKYLYAYMQKGDGNIQKTYPIVEQIFGKSKKGAIAFCIFENVMNNAFEYMNTKTVNYYRGSCKSYIPTLSITISYNP